MFVCVVGGGTCTMYVSVYIVYYVCKYRYKYQKGFYPIKGCVGGVLSRVLVRAEGQTPLEKSLREAFLV